MSNVSFELDQMKGLGEVSAAKLNTLGIYNIKDLAVAGSADIATILGKSQDWASELVLAAHRFLRDNDVIKKDFLTAREYGVLEKTRKKIRTGVDSLDEMLGGGIETRCVTEFYGKFSSGKSQICFTLSVLATLPEDQGGLDGNTLYMDVEGTFSTIRLEEIIKERGLDPDIVDKIIRVRPDSAAMLEYVTKELSRIVEESNIKLIVVDSIIMLHRQEFMGRGNLSPRQQKLSAIMNKLLKIAETYNIAVVITNQISSDPGANPLYGEEVDHATGGNVIAHASSHRIRLEKFGKKIKAKMIDSPRLSNSECLFMLNERGIDKFEK